MITDRQVRDVMKALRILDPELYDSRLLLLKAEGGRGPAPVLSKLSGSVLAEKADAAADNVVPFRISTPDVDRDGDVVEPLGMINADYRKNPIVLWGHNDYRPPIARSLFETASPAGVDSDAEFDVVNDPDGFVAAILGKYKTGFLSATSIRFRPKKFEKRIVQTPDTGEDVWNGGFVIHAWDLYEYSGVTVPAQPNALRRSADLDDSEIERVLGPASGGFSAAPDPAGVGTGDPVDPEVIKTLTELKVAEQTVRVLGALIAARAATRRISK